jgi:hypothetical protein
METQKYNGWSNYATWRVHLEMFYGMDLNEYQLSLDSYALSIELEAFVRCIIDEQAEQGTIANDYANAFISSVDWNEIAESLLEEHKVT